MTGLWIVAALLTAGTLVVVLWPLLRGKAAPAADRADYDLTVYKDQLGEIDRDLERGLMDESQAEAARVEIQRRMLAVAPEEGAPVSAGGRNIVLVVAVAVVVAVGSIGVYLTLGKPGLPDLPLASRNLEGEQQAQRDAEMKGLVDQLAARLEKNPNDLQGWVLLGRSYDRMERYAQAADAFAKAAELAGRPPELLGALAEALVMDAGDRIPELAKPILAELNAKDPADPRPYFYLGADKAQSGDLKGAMQEWVNLKAVSPSDVPWLTDLNGRIASAAKTLGIDPASVTPTVEAPAPAAQTPGPTAEEMEAAAQMTPEERQAMIRSMVERLAERLEENPEDREGWLRLAKAYEVLGDAVKAGEARARAEALAK